MLRLWPAARRKLTRGLPRATLCGMEGPPSTTMPTGRPDAPGGDRPADAPSAAARRLAFADLPGWPRYLTRAQAAAYLGVSRRTFDLEVRSGVWPGPLRRGPKGGLRTWDRAALDAAADALSSLLLARRGAD